MKVRTIAVVLIACLCLIVFAPAQAAPPAGELKLQGHTGAVLGLAFAPDGEMLASGAQDGTVRLWRVDDGTLLRTLVGHTGDVFSVGFSPDGKTLASGAADNSVRLWRVDDGKLLHTLDEHTGAVRSVAFAPDGKTLASGAADDTVQLWQVNDGKLLRTLAGHTGGVYSVTFAPDGKTLASGAADNAVRMWRVGDGKLLWTLAGHTGAVHSVAFAPDGKLLASGADDAAVRLWQVSDGRPLQALALDYNIAPIVSIAFDPDGAQLVAWQGYFLSQWQMDDGALLQRVKVDQMGRRIAPMSTGAASPDGVTLASAAADFTIRLWPSAGAFAEAASTPTASSVSVPNIVVPNIVVPSVNIPNIVVPNIVVPSVNVPSVNVPSVNVPSVNVPSVNVPNIVVPSVNVPNIVMPSINMPNTVAPGVPDAADNSAMPAASPESSMADYAAQATQQISAFAGAAETLANLAQHAKPSDSGWLRDLNAQLAAMDLADVALLEIVPPAEAAALHEQIIGGTWGCSDARVLVAGQLAGEGTAKWQDVATAMEACRAAMATAQALLDEQAPASAVAPPVRATLTPAAQPAPTASSAPAAAVQSSTPEMPARPPTALLDRYGNGTGQGELNVKNGTDGDGVVILADLDDEPLLAAYIRSGESYRLTGIPDGEYRLFFSKGDRWDDKKKAFTRRVSRQRFEDAFLFTSTATSYSVWDVTLYGVAGGNAGAVDVAEGQFPTLP